MVESCLLLNKKKLALFTHIGPEIWFHYTILYLKVELPVARTNSEVSLVRFNVDALWLTFSINDDLFWVTFSMSEVEDDLFLVGDIGCALILTVLLELSIIWGSWVVCTTPSLSSGIIFSVSNFDNGDSVRILYKGHYFCYWYF